MEELLKTLTSGSGSLSEAGFSSYYIFLYNSPGVLDRDFKLILSCTENTLSIIDDTNSYFEKFGHIIERLLLRENPSSFCIYPLCESDDIFGFIIYNKLTGPFTRTTSSDTSCLLSSTLKSIKQINITKDAYKKLESTQQELQKEMEVARTIQTALLPLKLHHNDFDMAAKMITAIAVGGDYYDLIHVAGRDWFVIGDVSGHGVHAGLIMMMVQTSIHLILTREPHISPKELLDLINKVITENIRKLGEDKYMTITVIAYNEDGKFIFSGMHLPLLLYRKKTETIEILETNGMWLGLLDDISQFNKNTNLYMEKGDCLLLYTDGITEAMKAETHQLFGNTKLQETFKGVAKESCKHIIESILQDLSEYQYDDDITLFALKRL